MLWNEIYNFFIRYIFGGYSIDGNYFVGNSLFSVYYSNDSYSRIYSKDVLIELFGQNITIGNYFSLIATIISMVVILVLCCMLIKKIYNICAHIIG